MERNKQDFFISVLAIEEALNPTTWAYGKGKYPNAFTVKEPYK